MLLVQCSISLSGCDFNRTGPVASYITVDSLVPGDASGTRLASPLPGRVIPDVSLFIDGNPIGTYDLGTLKTNGLDGRMAVPFTGSHRLDVYGVVRSNGLSSQRVAYPFWDSYSKTVDLKEDGRIDLGTIVLKATAGIVDPLPVNETFGDSILDLTAYGMVPLKREVGTLAVAGEKRIDDGYGVLRSTTHDSAQVLGFQVKAAIENTLQKQGSLYLEMDVRNNVSFQYGLFALTGPSQSTYSEVGLIKASDGHWRRLYLFLGTGAQAIATGLGIKFGLFAFSDTAMAADSYIAVDNVRLVHLK